MKKIFKEWGGTIIVVIAIVALIGLVTLLMQPGGLMEGAFGNISQAFVNKSGELIADAGKIKWTVPSGGTYTTVSGTVYNEGAVLPADYTPVTGDTFRCGDYEYKFNYEARGSCAWYYEKEFYNGWGVDTINNDQVSYGEILESINGMPVVSMNYTFYSCKQLVVPPEIPSSVRYLQYTFSDCVSLTDLSDYVIPGSVRNMDSAFKSCSSLTHTPVISYGVTSMMSTFSNCKALTNDFPTIPDSVTSLSSTFAYCTGLTDARSLIIPESATVLSNMFTDCKNLKYPPLVIPSKVTEIGSMFKNCTALLEAPDLSKAVELKLMGNAFYNCSKLVEAPVIPDSVTNIYETFKGCENLTTVPEGFTIPSGVTKMYSTFENCYKLSGIISIDANPSNYSYCFSTSSGITAQDIVLSGMSTKLQEIANTSTSGARVVYDINGNILSQ